MKNTIKESTSNYSPNILENLLEINFSNMNDKIKEELDSKFLCPQKFAQDIESLVKECKINYIDAIVTYCEENSIELDTISKLVSKPLKEKLKNDAIELNFLKKTTRAKLPL
jgi:phosphopantetheine adenylyltransferase